MLLLDLASLLRIMILQLVDTEARKVCCFFFLIAALSLLEDKCNAMNPTRKSEVMQYHFQFLLITYLESLFFPSVSHP